MFNNYEYESLEEAAASAAYTGELSNMVIKEKVKYFISIKFKRLFRYKDSLEVVTELINEIEAELLKTEYEHIYHQISCQVCMEKSMNEGYVYHLMIVDHPKFNEYEASYIEEVVASILDDIEKRRTPCFADSRCVFTLDGERMLLDYFKSYSRVIQPENIGLFHEGEVVMGGCLYSFEED